MNVQNRNSAKRNILSAGFMLVVLIIAIVPSVTKAQNGFDPTIQTQTLLYDEARTVYLGNLARRDNGVPPLRWNLQLTHASRWFSWDSTENRPGGYCGHQDTLSRWPGDRALYFGYLGSAGAENAFCGYVTPEYAIQGWMNSSGHRANLLDPNSREVGLGYYRRESDGRGYVAQGFGNDAVYAPVIIDDEAISTTSPNVNLYIYDRVSGGGFTGFDPAAQMMISNDIHFSSASWEPYTANKAWILLNGEGWRDVHVKTRDKFNRSMTVSDTIYLGSNIPLNELGAAQMSTTKPQVMLYNLNGGALPQVQFSLGWMADDTFGSFGKLWGNGERINDAAAWGGTAYRLYPGDGESFAWVYDTNFIKNTPFTAYFRLKVNNNSSSNEVARIEVQGGPTVYGPLKLKGTDFAVANQYQEFALNFTFNPTSDDPFLLFKFWRSGAVDVYVDAVSIFSTPQAITSPLTWSVPGGNYRGQGVWVRYTNGVQFSGISDGITTPYTISGNTGVRGATVSYNDGSNNTDVTNGDGNYTITVPGGWSGTVTPTHPCFTFTPANRSYTNITANQTGQDYTATFNPASGCSNVNVNIGGNSMGSYTLANGEEKREYYPVSGGPVKVESTNDKNIVSAIRLQSFANNTLYSFVETMGVPQGLLSHKYYFPTYNNTWAPLNSQVRFGNLDAAQTRIRVTIGGVNVWEQDVPGLQERRLTFNVSGGPVVIESLDPAKKIVAAIRLQSFGNNTLYSFSETMGIPDQVLSHEYYFPTYNNTWAPLNSQVRFGNLDADPDHASVSPSAG